MRQVFLDTETTGLSPEAGDRVVEIGCIEMDNRRLTGRQLHLYLNPERKNGEEAVRIHGLTDEFLADKPRFAEIADEFMAFIAGADLIIHNAAFDVGFLNAELRRIQRPPLSEQVGRITDTLLMAREMFPGKSNSLDALCKRLEVDNASRTLHGALLDAGLLAEVFIRLTRGQDALVIEVATATQETSTLGVSAIDLSTLQLPVLEATEVERASHELLLTELDKASGGKTLWRNLVA